MSSSSRQAAFLRESSSKVVHGPTGLVVLAVIQFFFAAVSILSLILAVSSETMQAELHRQGVTITPYTVVTLLITSTVLVASGIGYLSQNRLFGYWGGNLLGVGSIANVMVHNVHDRFAQFPMYIPSLFFPIILLFVLNVFFRRDFR